VIKPVFVDPVTNNAHQHMQVHAFILNSHGTVIDAEINSLEYSLATGCDIKVQLHNWDSHFLFKQGSH